MENKQAELEQLLEKAKEIAVSYRKLTGKPLGITGEIGEAVAAKKLNLSLADARQAGYDAVDGEGRKIQIKSRVVGNISKITGRMGAIKVTNDWDCVQLVIMTDDFDVVAIYEADRESVVKAIGKSESRARQRGALAITEFIRFGIKVWPSETFE